MKTFRPAAQARAEEEAGEADEAAAEGEADGEAAEASGSGLPWDGSDRDYHYEELLGGSPACMMSGFMQQAMLFGPC